MSGNRSLHPVELAEPGQVLCHYDADRHLVRYVAVRLPVQQVADGCFYGVVALYLRILADYGLYGFVCKASAVAWGCDLTHEYVSINADYRS